MISFRRPTANVKRLAEAQRIHSCSSVVDRQRDGQPTLVSMRLPGCCSFSSVMETNAQQCHSITNSC